MASTFIPGVNSLNRHYIPGYTGHCPLLQFSMGQTYGQMTGQLLQGPTGLAWPPAHRTLLPPIRAPSSPEVPLGSPSLRCGRERLSFSMIPGYTGFVPRAQFIFAKNCSQVWAEALNDFTQRQSQELPKEAQGEKDAEKDQEAKLELELEAKKEPGLEQEAGRVTARRKELGLASTFFFYELPLPRLLPTPWMTETLRSSCQALQEFGQKYSRGRRQKDPKHLPPLSRTYPQNSCLLPNYGDYVPGYKFQFGHTYGHLTHDALGLSTLQKQLPV